MPFFYVVAFTTESTACQGQTLSWSRDNISQGTIPQKERSLNVLSPETFHWLKNNPMLFIRSEEYQPKMCRHLSLVSSRGLSLLLFNACSFSCAFEHTLWHFLVFTFRRLHELPGAPGSSILDLYREVILIVLTRHNRSSIFRTNQAACERSLKTREGSRSSTYHRQSQSITGI